MIEVLCALASGAMFFLSNGIGDIWPLAFVAPLPVLWLAFGPAPLWRALAAAFAAFAIGQCNLFIAYGDVFPPAVLAIALIVPSSVFALAVLLARAVAQRAPGSIALFAFPAAYTAAEYLLFLASPDGTAGSIAYTLAGAPLFIQSAALFGLWSITFLVMLVPAGAALALQAQSGRLATIGVTALIVGAYLGFGAQQLNDRPSATTRVGLATNDALLDAVFANDEASALGTVRAYDAVVRDLAAKGAHIVVVPEKFAVLSPAWRKSALEVFETTAREAKVTLVAGFDWREGDGVRRNAAVLFRPDGTTALYFKQHLVQGLEASFVPGRETVLVDSNVAIAVCKDMDFPATIIAAAYKGAGLMLVPAWDFRRDDFAHARIAFMRGVEGGFAVARAANQGLMTVTDAQGSIIAQASSSRAGFKTLIADVPTAPVATIYARVGDLFAWLCLGALLLFLVLALWPRLSFRSSKT